MAEAAVDVPIVATEEKSVEIKIEDAGAHGGAKPAPIVSADEGIKSLQEQVERAKRESAERLAHKDRQIADAFKQASEAQREVITVKRDQIGTIIDNWTKDKDAARRDYRIAMEAGDFDKAAEAQDRISTAAARIVKAEEGKFELDEQAKRPPAQASASDAPSVVEAVARTMGTQRSADWVRRHPEVVVNGSLSSKALEAHYAAVNEGLEPDSDRYFQAIESRLKPQQVATPIDPARGRDMSQSVSAPVARDAPQVPGAQRPGSIRLEPHEVQTAIDTYSPLYPKESRDQLLQRYAKDKMALMDEGKIGRRA